MRPGRTAGSQSSSGRVRRGVAWCGEGSPRPLKAIRSRAQLKLMQITFFDHAGLLSDQAVPVGQIVNGDYYLSVLKKVGRAINDKWPELENAGPILLQDNAGPHRKREVLQTLDTWSWELLPHPLYSPDLSPCDFFLFLRMKKQIRGQHFSSEQEINEAYRQSLITVAKLGLHDGIFDPVSRWWKCIEHEGSYFENSGRILPPSDYDRKHAASGAPLAAANGSDIPTFSVSELPLCDSVLEFSAIPSSSLMSRGPFSAPIFLPSSTFLLMCAIAALSTPRYTRASMPILLRPMFFASSTSSHVLPQDTIRSSMISLHFSLQLIHLSIPSTAWNTSFSLKARRFS